MAMKRVWLVGVDWQGHSQMPGVILNIGSPVDVPEDLAATLLASGDFVDEQPGEHFLTEIRAKHIEVAPEPLIEVLGMQEQPETLQDLEGFGPKRRERLGAWGIYTVQDLADLPDALMDEIARQEPGISKSLLRRWRLQAQE